MAVKYKFGVTPWGNFFIDAMERLADTGRLQRGRSYAGSGAVHELSIKNGVVKAKVEGNYRPFYKVQIAFKPLPLVQQDFIKKMFETDPLLKSRISGGELPETFLKTIAAQKIALVPKKWNDMERSCNCPDYGDPCKHQAAVYYLLAQEIDRDPFVLFALRGIDQKILQGRGIQEYANSEFANNKKIIENPLPIQFIKNNEEFLQLSFAPNEEADNNIFNAELTPYTSLMPKLLPPSRGLAPFDVKAMLAELYHLASASVYDFLDELATRDDESSYAQERLFAQSSFAPVFDGKTMTFIQRKIYETESEQLFTMLQAASMFASNNEKYGSSSFQFFKLFFSLARSIISAGAFYPDVFSSEKRFGIIWKAARFDEAINNALIALEAYVVMPKVIQQDTEAENIPNPRSTIELLLSKLIGDYIKICAFEPKSKIDAAHPICAAMFRGALVSCSKPGEIALPHALDSWLSVFEILQSNTKLELTISIKNEDEFFLSANIVSADDTKKTALFKAMSNPEFDSTDTARIIVVLANFVPALSVLATKNKVQLSETEFEDFFLDASLLLNKFGVRLIVPKALQKMLKPRLAIRTSTKVKSIGQSFLGIDAFAFDWAIAIGDENITAEDFLELVKKGQRLIRWKNTWVSIDALQASYLLEQLRSKQNPSAMDAMRLALNDDIDSTSDFASFLDNIQNAEKTHRPPPEGLNAVLRDYQERGYSWMLHNFSLGLGCLLADDMGLGKTIQTIAAILRLKDDDKLQKGALICAPASLLSNWEKEIQRFAPNLSVHLYHGLRRKKQKADIILSSYETWVRDSQKASKKSSQETYEDFDIFILDEAHYIKNPSSQRAKNIKKVKANCRLALTGTPVENNLGELWSIFDFILPGLLSNYSFFTSEFRKPIELDRSAQAVERLQKVTSPFMLRRLKTDKSIAASLPDKIILNEYAALVPEQTALYQAAVSEGLSALASSDNEKRLGIILSMLTALKQISNHPLNFDKKSPAETALSGKSRLLIELLKTIIQNGERVLVFSQYVQMLEILQTIVQKELAISPYILHGGISRIKREETVAQFQNEKGPAVFLISLKAGGVGLNLTAATRVIHYDLWYNPAVENQATDRAFRIGQKQNVFVHRLVSSGTIDEKIDAMIESKRELSDLTVKSGESWIGDLSNDEIKDLVSLRKQ